MNKRLMFMVVVLVSCFASQVLAAPITVGVPKDHWAYAAIQELVKKGIIDGYSDGTKTMTRHEMAQIVEKAIANSAKATIQQKYLIDKLGTEFALELNKVDTRVPSIDTRVNALEKNQSRLKITGLFSSRYEWVQNPLKSGYIAATSVNDDGGRNGIADSSSTIMNRLWLWMDNKFDDNTYFHGLLGSYTVGGRTTNTPTYFMEGFVATKMGTSELAVGRFFPSIGMGFFASPWMDGARYSFGNDNAKYRVFATRLIDNPYTKGSADFFMADAKFALNKDTTMSLGYVGNSSPVTVYNYDSTKNVTNSQFKCYDDVAVGLEYKGIKNVSIKSEYTVNSSDSTKFYRPNHDSAKSYFVTAKYKGANPYQKGSFGAKIEYKYADYYFNRLYNAAPFEWNSPYNWNGPCIGSGYSDNIKGWELGIEYTIAPRLLLDVRYDAVKLVDKAYGYKSTDGIVHESQNFSTATVTYFF